MPATTIDDRLLDFLADPDSYPHEPAKVYLIHTHISVVAIAPPLVFKVKKPVSLGFLDFSTLSKRRHYCARELTLNRRLCPDIYLGIVPISCDPETGRYVFGGRAIVDYAVKMRYLEHSTLLSTRVQQGSVLEEHIDRVADRLTRFYQSADAEPPSTKWGAIEFIRISTDENFRQTRSHVSHLVSRPGMDIIHRYTTHFLTAQDRLFDRRMRDGRILDCHGDLRLEHISLGSERTCIFDCIEFNERFRYIDLASDIAFLAMDLDFHGRPDLASHLARRVAKKLKDEDLLTILDFYKCYRSHVRAKVEGIRASERDVPAASRSTSENVVRAHYRLALRYAVVGSSPSVVLVMGRAASGKSYLARELAKAMDLPLISSDVIRKDAVGIPRTYRGSAAERADLYSPDRTKATYAELLARTLRHVGSSQSVVVDASFGRKSLRAGFLARLDNLGVEHRTLELYAPDAVLRQRLKARESEAEVVSDARLEDFPILSGGYQPPGRRESIPRLDATTSKEETVHAALGLLAGSRIG